MATALFLNANVGGVLNLIGGPDYELEDGGLQINPPNITEEYAMFPGGELPVNKTMSNRTIIITLSVYGTDEDDLVANLSALEDRCIQSWKYFTTHGSGQRNSLAVMLGNETNFHYFWILSGKVILPGNAFSAAQISQFDATTGTYYIRNVQLVLTCKPLIYDVDPIVWNTTTYNQLLNTTIENESTSSADNGAYINSNLPKGDYLSPLRIEVFPNGGTTKKLVFGIGKAQVGGYDYREYVREAESGTYYNVTGQSSPSDATASNNVYKTFSISTTTERGAWADLTSTYFFPTGTFRVFAVFTGNIPANVKFQLAMKYAFSEYMDYGQVAYKPAGVSTLYTLDMGTFYNPARNDPYLASQTSQGKPSPILYFWTTDGQSTEIDFDALYVIPQDLAYRVVEFKGDPLDATGQLIDDAWNESVFGSDIGQTNFVPDCEGFHNPLWVPANQPLVFKSLLLGAGGLLYNASITSTMRLYSVSTSLTYGAF